MLITLGSAVIAAAYLMADGSWSSVVNQLMRRPGPALIVGGLLLAGAGFLLLVPRGGGIAWTILVRMPKMLAGVVLLNLGYVAVVLGAWEWLDPRGFERVAGTFSQTYDVNSATRALRGWLGLGK
jgi:hypothetical protein